MTWTEQDVKSNVDKPIKLPDNVSNYKIKASTDGRYRLSERSDGLSIAYPKYVDASDLAWYLNDKKAYLF